MRLTTVLTAIALAIFLAGSASAMATLDYGTHPISVTLQSGEDTAYLINMGAGDRLVVNLGVVSGGPVDFYLTNLTAYNAYRAGFMDSLFYLGGQSREDSTAAIYSYDSLVANEYVLLIDNSASTDSGAAPSGSVTVEGKITVERNIWTLQNIVITAAIVAGIIAFMVYIRWPKRQGRRR